MRTVAGLVLRRIAHRLILLLSLVVSLFVASVAAAPFHATAEAPGEDPDAVVAEEVPTFGGMYIDDDSRTLYVWLTDKGESLPAAVQALRKAAGSPQLPELYDFTPVALPARYSYLQLKAWDDRMGPLLSVPGLVFSGIDDRNNRLVVGVEDLATQGPRVEAQLVDLDIPLAAVRIVQQEPIILDVANQSLLPMLIGSAIGVILLVGAVAFFVRRKKRPHHRPEPAPILPAGPLTED